MEGLTKELLSEVFMNFIDEDMFHGKTEQEAIFKACQWVLEQKDKQ